MEGTRWEPRKVFCTRRKDHADAPGDLYAVKFRQGSVGTAALISEVVCHALLLALGIRVLDPALVAVSQDLARSYQHADVVAYRVEPGLHFGTRLRPELFPGPPEVWEQLAEPEELIHVWVVDSWLMNLDRGTYGNLLLEMDTQSRWHLVAADQSDCFLGSGALADGSCFTRGKRHGAASYLTLLERALLEQGPAPLRALVDRVRRILPLLPEVMERVPAIWWREAGVSPDALIECLCGRADRLHEIVEVRKWEEVRNASRGARQLDL